MIVFTKHEQCAEGVRIKVSTGIIRRWNYIEGEYEFVGVS